MPREQLIATRSQKYGSLWRLHYCNSKDEFAESETMFARKVKSVFDKLIPRQAKFKKTMSPHWSISILAIKFFSRPTKTTLHSGKYVPSNKVYIVQGRKTPANAMWTSSGNAVWINLRNHHKIPAKSRSTQYLIISISTRLKSLQKYDPREEKENLRNHST